MKTQLLKLPHTPLFLPQLQLLPLLPLQLQPPLSLLLLLQLTDTSPLPTDQLPFLPLHKLPESSTLQLPPSSDHPLTDTQVPSFQRDTPEFTDTVVPELTEVSEDTEPVLVVSEPVVTVLLPVKVPDTTVDTGVNNPIKLLVN